MNNFTDETRQSTTRAQDEITGYRTSNRNKKIIQQWKINYRLWKQSTKNYDKMKYRYGMTVHAMRLIGMRL